jgi:hypothetical protein
VKWGQWRSRRRRTTHRCLPGGVMRVEAVACGGAGEGAAAFCVAPARCGEVEQEAEAEEAGGGLGWSAAGWAAALALAEPC